MKTPPHARRRVVAIAVAFTLTATVGGCGGKPTKSLTWWALPDRVGAEALAQQCSNVTDGYRIDVRTLPTNLAARRADLIRRLSAGDDDVDILTLDSALTPEFASAGYLAKLPGSLSSRAGLVGKAAEAATYQGKMVAVPWWIDPQMLWFRGAAAERANINTAKPVSWDALLAGADRIRASVQFDDADGTGVSDWVRALVAESGGVLLAGNGRSPKVGLAGDPGRVAAGIVQFYAASGLGAGPSPGALTEFSGSRGAFLLARASARTAPAVGAVATDMKPIRYPVINGVSVAPLASAALAVPKSSDEPKAAFQAINCLTSFQSEVEVMRLSGRGAARTAVYSSPRLHTAVPFAQTILDAAKTGINVPSTPHWHRAEEALRRSWTPLSSVRPGETPKESALAVYDLVQGGLR